MRQRLLRQLLAEGDRMESALRRAPLDEGGLPALTGLTWDPTSPTAGTVIDVAPFRDERPDLRGRAFREAAHDLQRRLVPQLRRVADSVGER